MKIKKNFYCVFSDTGSAPKKVHNTFEEANNEMIRLAMSNPNREFYVMKTVVGSVSTVVPESITMDDNIGQTCLS